MNPLKKWLAMLVIVGSCLSCSAAIYSFFFEDFSASYQSGLERGKFSGKGFFTCATTRETYDYYFSRTIAYQSIILTTNAQNIPQYIFIKIPANATLGRHDLTNNSYSQIGYEIILYKNPWVSRYAESGYLYLEALPKGAGQRAKGFFYVNYGELTLKGEFNFRSNDKGVYSCIQ